MNRQDAKATKKTMFEPPRRQDAKKTCFEPQRRKGAKKGVNNLKKPWNNSSLSFRDMQDNGVMRVEPTQYIPLRERNRQPITNEALDSGMRQNEIFTCAFLSNVFFAPLRLCGSERLSWRAWRLGGSNCFIRQVSNHTHV